MKEEIEDVREELMLKCDQLAQIERKYSHSMQEVSVILLKSLCFSYVFVILAAILQGVELGVDGATWVVWLAFEPKSADGLCDGSWIGGSSDCRAELES